MFLILYLDFETETGKREGETLFKLIHLGKTAKNLESKVGEKNTKIIREYLNIVERYSEMALDFPEIYKNMVNKTHISEYVNEVVDRLYPYEKSMPQHHKYVFIDIFNLEKENFKVMLDSIVVEFSKLLGAIFFKTSKKKVLVQNEITFNKYKEFYTGFESFCFIYSYENYHIKQSIFSYLLEYIEKKDAEKITKELIDDINTEKPFPFEKGLTWVESSFHLLKYMSKRHFEKYPLLSEAISRLIEDGIITEKLFLKQGKTLEDFKTALKHFVIEHNKQTCPICGKEFVKDKKNKTTCGNARCKVIKSRMKKRAIEFMKKRNIDFDNTDKTGLYNIMKEMDRQRIITSKRQHKKYKKIKNLKALSDIIYEELKGN